MKTAALLLSLMLLTLLAYANTFHSPMVYDDYATIARNPIVRTDTVKPSIWGRWLLYASFAANYRYGGEDVTGYHIVNLALHLTNGCLVFFIARRLFA